MLTVVSLFAGIGGFELGLEAAGGFVTVGQVERDPYCLKVLARHWPNVPRHTDVETAPEWWASIGAPEVDVITAGFPCQPFSLAGKRLGVNDERWMWPATRSSIRALRPRYVLLENVAALVRDARAFGAVLSDLHSLGFDAEWATLRASDFGAPTPRRRVYVLAYAAGNDGLAHDRVEAGGGRRSSLQLGGLSGLDVYGRRRAAAAWLEREPRVDRLVDGIPNQSQRLDRIGNAVVPAVIEHFGRLILDFDAARAAA